MLARGIGTATLDDPQLLMDQVVPRRIDYGGWMAENHDCGCWKCQPVRFPLPLTQLGEHHVGLRFGDAGRRGRWRIRVEGVEVPHVLEACAGHVDGWAYVFADPVHLCARCQTGICSLLLHGRVEVRFLGDGHGP